MDAERETVNGLLAKLDVVDAASLPPERAVQKLTLRLKKKGVPAELTEAEAAMVKKLGFVEGKAPAAPAAPKAEKPAAKKAKGKGTPAAKKPAAAPAAKKEPKEPKAPAKKRESHGAEVFKKFFEEKGKTVDKAKLIEKLVGAGVKAATASSYIVWAKRTKKGNPGKAGNPFEFRITESKTDKGVKLLQRA